MRWANGAAILVVVAVSGCATSRGVYDTMGNGNQTLREYYSGGPPHFDDPVAEGYRERFLKEKAAYKNDPTPFVSSVNGVNTCADANMAVIEKTLLWGNTFQQLQESPMNVQAGVKYAPLRWRMVEGTCVNGVPEGFARLAGRLEANVEGSWGTSQVTQQITVLGEFRSGALFGSEVRYESTKNVMNYTDPNMKNAMANVDEETRAMQESATLAFSYGKRRGESLDGPMVRFTFQDKSFVETTAYSVEVEPGLLFNRNWTGKNPTSESYTLDGWPHGEFVNYASNMMGVEVPEQRFCYKRGQLVDSNACNGAQVDPNAGGFAGAKVGGQVVNTPATSQPAQDQQPSETAPTRRVAATPWPEFTDAMAAIGGGENDAAVVVGVEDYAFVADVPGAAKNAKDWYRYFTRVRKVSPGNIKLLIDIEATDTAMLDAVESASKLVKPGGTLWFIYIGHGAPSEDQKDGVLIGVDAQQSARGLYGRSVPQRKLLEVASAGEQTNTVFVVDACFSGRGGDGGALAAGLQPLLPVKNKAFASKGKETIVLSAGRADQFAGPLPKLERPAFSYLMLGGLLGWADADNDGNVSTEEAVLYADDTLRATLTGRNQNPSLEGSKKFSVKSVGAKGPDVSAIVVGD